MPPRLILAVGLLKVVGVRQPSLIARCHVAIGAEAESRGFQVVQTYGIDGRALRDELVLRALAERLRRGDVRVLVAADDITTSVIADVRHMCAHASVHIVPAHDAAA